MPRRINTHDAEVALLSLIEESDRIHRSLAVTGSKRDLTDHEAQLFVRHIERSTALGGALKAVRLVARAEAEAAGKA